MNKHAYSVSIYYHNYLMMIIKPKLFITILTIFYVQAEYENVNINITLCKYLKEMPDYGNEASWEHKTIKQESTQTYYTYIRLRHGLFGLNLQLQECGSF